MPTTKQTYGRVSLLLVAFTLSGASGLILQILWTLTVSTFFGVSAHAIATILAAFMGGLALGSWMGNRIVSKSSLSPLLLYAISEVIIVVSAIAIQLFFTHNSSLAHWMATYLSGYTFGALFLRFLLLGLLLLIPTSAMGASFPFFLRALVPKSGLDLRTVSAAYGCNVLGAAAGCFLTASVFLMKWGIPKTVFLACCMNGMAALIAYFLRRPVSEAVHQPKQSPVFSTKVLYFLVACSGFSAMAFEVLWSRIYRQALWLANPFQAFSYTLSLILIGMGIGSLLLLFVNRDRHSAIRLFAKLQWITAAFCILGITHIRWDIAFLFPGDPSFLYRTLSTLVLSGGAVTLGMGFPLLAKSHENIDKIGHLYALSALGGVLGTITGGFVLLPVLGVRGSLLFLSVGFVLTGILASQTQDARPWKLRRLPITIGLLTSLFAALGIGTATEDRIDFECHDCTLLWLNDGLEATTAVVRSAQGSNILYTDGRAIMPGALPQRTLTPFLVAPTIKRVLSIGFGSGQLARLVAQSFPKSQVDCVELDGNMVQTTEFFGTSDIFSLP
ncbi:MAG: hypothetical protein VX278_05415, partial [Myxococcota bacterium]|nr:hypothetical protein [Myxococcota bacterium]